MLVRHFFTPRLAHSSYIIAGGSVCAVVDPSRDVQAYLSAAAELGVRITHVLETHLHADFVSGHMDLASITGARVVMPAQAECRFPHLGVREGDVLEIENIRLDVMETPGHTPEHVSFTVTDTSRGDSPAGVFCGDTLFVGDVGRPDLFPGMAEELASKLFDSLRKLMALPDHCEVYPAHGAGSLCGRAISSKYTSTVGYERRFNPAAAATDRSAFIHSLTGSMPPAPDHFARCSGVNRSGPAAVASIPPPEPLEAGAFHKAIGRGDCFVLDVRRYEAFAGLHVPRSWSIDFTGNLPTFAGWVIPPDRDILLVATDEAEALETAVWLRRVGLDRVKGHLQGGMFQWTNRGLPAGHLRLVTAQEAAGSIKSGSGPQVLDVRAQTEFAGFHLPGALNIPAPDLRTGHSELDPSGDYLLVCSTGQRSVLAAGILLSLGFRNVACLAGGMKGYGAATNGPECPMCAIPHGPGAFNGQAPAPGHP